MSECKTCGGSGSVQKSCPDSRVGCAVYHAEPCPTCHGKVETSEPVQQQYTDSNDVTETLDSDIPANMQSGQAHDKGYAKETAEIEHIEPVKPADELELDSVLVPHVCKGWPCFDCRQSRRNFKALITREIVAEVYGLHESIMRHELQLGQEPDQAFNYARIHRWIEARIEQLKKGGKQ